MAQWSQQPGAVGAWHLVTEIDDRPGQANSFVKTTCKRAFPEINTQTGAPTDPNATICPICSAASS